MTRPKKMFYYLLGGLSCDMTQEDVELFISDELKIECLWNVWVDRFCESRAVMQCSEELDTKCVQSKINGGDGKRFFLTEEKATITISVCYPNSKCEALIDILPWVFHQKKKNGSKVRNITQMPEDNSYRLTFSDGCDAASLTHSTWKIGNDELQVHPVFACFNRSYEDQRKQYLYGKYDENIFNDPKQSPKLLRQETETQSRNMLNIQKEHTHHTTEVKMVADSPRTYRQRSIDKVNPSGTVTQSHNIPRQIQEEQDSHDVEPKMETVKPIQQHKTSPRSDCPIEITNAPAKPLKEVSKSIYTDRFLLVLLNCLSVCKQLKMIFPVLEVSIDIKEECINVMCSEILRDQLQSMVLKLSEITEDENMFELFLDCQKDQQAIAQYFSDNQVYFTVEDTGDQLVPKVMAAGKKIYFERFCSTIICCVVKIFYTKSTHRNYVTSFNEENSLFKLKFARPKDCRTNAWHLLQFCNGFSDERMSIVEKIIRYLKEKGVLQCVQFVSTGTQRLPMSKIIHALFKVYDQLQSVIERKFEGIKLLIDDDEMMIELSGETTIIEKLKNVFLSLDDFFKSESDTFYHRIKEHITPGSMSMLFEENSKGDIELFVVEKKDVKKKRFYEFVAEMSRMEMELLNRPNETEHDSDESDMEYHDAPEDQSDAHNAYSLTRKNAEFLSRRSNFDSFKKRFENRKVVKGIKIVDKKLYCDCDKKDVADCFNEIKTKLEDIECESITLPFPGVPDFFNSFEGKRVFSDIEIKHKCVFLLDHQEDSRGNDIMCTTYYYGTLLGTIIVNDTVRFHVVQGDARNMKVDMSIHISYDQQLRAETKNAKSKIIYLPDWHVEGETFENRKAKQGELKSRLEAILRPFLESVGSFSLSLSVSNNNKKSPFPDNVLSQCLIKDIFYMLKKHRNTIHIFLCESESCSLINAFKNELTALGSSYSKTYLETIDNYLLESLSDHVSHRVSVPEYSNVSIKVMPKIPKTHDGTVLLCCPIQSPFDRDRCTLKNYDVDWRTFTNVLQFVEQSDGLGVGELIVDSRNSNGKFLLALFGCQDWGVDIAKALQNTLENCIKKANQLKCNSLYIEVPGTARPWMYSAKLTAAKWFQYLDRLVRKNEMTYKGTIHFITPSDEHHEAFKSHLKERISSGRKTREKFDDASFKLSLVTDKLCKKNEIYKALRKELERLMNKNKSTITRELALEEHYKKNMQHEDRVFWEFKKKTKNEFELCLRGLLKKVVVDVESALSLHKGNGSSVDPHKFGEEHRNQNHSKWKTAQIKDDTQYEQRNSEKEMGHPGEKKEKSQSLDHKSASHGSLNKEKTELETKKSDAVFQWIYIKLMDNFYCFDQSESENIEKAYQDQKISFTAANLKIDFSSMTAANLMNVRFHVIRRESIPDKKSPKSLIQSNESNEDELDEIKRLVHSQLPSYCIQKIRPIQDQSLFNRYEYKKKETKQAFKHMWQRIQPDAETAIVQFGCEKSLMELDCTKLGDGIGFASDVKQCVKNEDKKEGNKVLLLRCLVCVGNKGKGQGKEGLRFPPIDKASGQYFTSVSDEQFCMVFNSALVLPTHFVLIQFEKPNDGAGK